MGWIENTRLIAQIVKSFLGGPRGPNFEVRGRYFHGEGGYGGYPYAHVWPSGKMPWPEMQAKIHSLNRKASDYINIKGFGSF
jgi:hypothetical protein